MQSPTTSIVLSLSLRFSFYVVSFSLCEPKTPTSASQNSDIGDESASLSRKERRLDIVSFPDDGDLFLREVSTGERRRSVVGVTEVMLKQEAMEQEVKLLENLNQIYSGLPGMLGSSSSDTPSSSSSSAIRAWRTAFLTLRDETLTSRPKSKSITQLLNDLIFSHFRTLMSAAPDLPPHEVTSDLLFLMELAASSPGGQDVSPIYVYVSSLVHAYLQASTCDSSIEFFFLGCCDQLFLRYGALLPRPSWFQTPIFVGARCGMLGDRKVIRKVMDVLLSQNFLVEGAPATRFYVPLLGFLHLVLTNAKGFQNDHVCESLLSDSDCSDSDGSVKDNDTIKSSKVRTAAIVCLQDLCLADPRSFTTQWTMILPTTDVLETRKFEATLLTCLLFDPYLKVRMASASTLAVMLDGPSSVFLQVAEYKESSKRGPFMALSSSLGLILMQLHAGLLYSIQQETHSRLLASLLKILVLLISATPYVFCSSKA
ncbi:unnamed protein product [Linum tenue]|uniref:DUF4042 domain-containing protein n=1 Tax=Linum tenue TaxID=586396 RepID=A0AAV0HF26_9ROSI|nr:unnamed protein product [Linum tenue]